MDVLSEVKVPLIVLEWPTRVAKTTALKLKRS